MQNERHLSEKEIAEIVIGGHRDAAHLDNCAKCRGELAGFAALAGSLRADLCAQAERSDAGWARQRVAIRERIRGLRVELRWAIAGMAAVIALGFGLVTMYHPVPHPPLQAQHVADDDDALLKGIQHTLAHRAPEPLMPAAVLVQEISANSGQGVKEN